jgi:hypothetical protein
VSHTEASRCLAAARRPRSKLVVGGSIIVAGLPIAEMFGRLKLKPKGKPARD